MSSDTSLPDRVQQALQTTATWVDEETAALQDERGDRVFGVNYRAEVQIERVEDGDTFRGRRRVDPGIVLGAEPQDPWYRLLEVDTHETDGEHAERAAEETEFATEWIREGREQHDGEWPFVVEYGAAQDDVEGTFGRLLVYLYRKSDHAELNQALLDEFDGVRYRG